MLWCHGMPVACQVGEMDMCRLNDPSWSAAYRTGMRGCWGMGMWGCATCKLLVPFRTVSGWQACWPVLPSMVATPSSVCAIAPV